MQQQEYRAHLDVEILPPGGNIRRAERLAPEPDLVQVAHEGVPGRGRGGGI